MTEYCAKLLCFQILKIHIQILLLAFLLNIRKGYKIFKFLHEITYNSITNSYRV